MQTNSTSPFSTSITAINSTVIITNDSEHVTAINNSAISDPMIAELVRLAQSFTIRQRTALLNAAYAIEEKA